LKLTIGGQEFDVQAGGDSVSIGATEYAVRVVRRGDIVTVYVNEKPFAIQVPTTTGEEGPLKILVDAKEYDVEVSGQASARREPAARARKQSAGAAGAVTAQMTGRIIRVDVKPGDEVKEGDVLLIIEAMKMENEIAAPVTGTVKEVAVAPGGRVTEGDLLVQIEASEAA